MFAGEQCIQHAACTDIKLLCGYADANIYLEFYCSIDCLMSRMNKKLGSRFQVMEHGDRVK